MITRDFVHGASAGGKRVKLWRFKHFLPLLSVGISLGVVISLLLVFFQLSVPVFLRSSAQGVVVYVPSQVDRSYPLIYRSKSDEKGKRLTLFMNPEESIDAPGGYGAYRLGAVYALYRQESKDEQYIRAAFSQILGEPLDGVYPYTLTAEEALAQEISAHVPTSVLQTLVGWVAGGELPSFHEHALSLPEVKSHILSYRKATQIAPADYCPVAILNGSGVQGRATVMSELLENLQFVVVHTATTPEPQLLSRVYISTKKSACEQKLSSLRAFFTTAPEEIREEQDTFVGTYRAGIVIILGKNY